MQTCVIVIRKGRIDFRTSDGRTGSDPVLENETAESVYARIYDRFKAAGYNIEVVNKVKTKHKGNLKLYVWEGVLTDYYDGLAVAYAHDQIEAMELLAKQLPASAMEELRHSDPKCYEVPTAVHVYGGG